MSKLGPGTYLRKLLIKNCLLLSLVLISLETSTGEEVCGFPANVTCIAVTFNYLVSALTNPTTRNQSIILMPLLILVLITINPSSNYSETGPLKDEWGNQSIIT